MEVDLKELQAKELEILIETVKILDKHNIKYFLAGGTCLGAVRHNGFIPWDDDIDIMLFREEYKKLPNIFKELPENLYYQDFKTEVQYPYNFAKIKMKNTALVQGGDAHLKMHHGIYIDIFPLDNAPQDIEECKKIHKKCKTIKTLLDVSCMDYSNKYKKRTLIQNVIIFFGKIFLNTDKLHLKLEKLMQSYNNIDTDTATCYLGLYGIRDIFSKKDTGDGISMKFEGIDFKVPNNYQEYLTSLYNDYMQLPPLEKRTSHHDVVLYSIDREFEF